MEIKNVKLGEYDLKDLLEEIKRLGNVCDTCEEGYNVMMDRINNLLLKLE